MTKCKQTTTFELDKNINIHSEGLPEPKALEKYDSIISNGGNRFMTIEEKKVENRIIIENKLIDNRFSLAKRGQSLNFILVLIILSIATYLIISGETLFRSVSISSIGLFIIRVFNYINKSA